jgi:glutamine amidotransferase
MNLLDLAAHIESPLFMAHVRATSLATIQETNCHPYRYNNWMFVHNGQIGEFGKFRQTLMSRVAPEYFENILGSTDSELMFHLALTFGLEDDVHGAVAEMVRYVESVGKEVGVDQCIWMTLGISDGKQLWAFRYGSDGKGPSLYVNPDMEELSKLSPAVRQLGADAVCIVSEPIGEFQHIWTQIPENSSVTADDHGITIVPFNP